MDLIRQHTDKPRYQVFCILCVDVRCPQYGIRRLAYALNALNAFPAGAYVKPRREVRAADGQ